MKKTVTTSSAIGRREFIVGTLAGAGALAAAGCGQADAAAGGASSSAATNDAATGANADNAAPSADAGASEQAGASSRVLVAYFSAQGHTERVAEDAAAALGADLFAIEPAEPYTADDLGYNGAQSRVSREHADAGLQEVALAQETPDGWDGYDAVLLGYPIWWGGASWVASSFVSANSFGAKKVVCFCTSASSGLGQSAQDLGAAADGGDWAEGRRFSSNASSDEVKAWAEGLGL